MTAIQGFADMEYPMMVNDATLEDLKDSRLTLDHEVVHTYFPFIWEPTKHAMPLWMKAGLRLSNIL